MADKGAMETDDAEGAARELHSDHTSKQREKISHERRSDDGAQRTHNKEWNLFQARGTERDACATVPRALCEPLARCCPVSRAVVVVVAWCFRSSLCLCRC